MNNPVQRKSYLQIHVPLDRRAQWYQDLKKALNDVKDLRWQNGFFHITAAFINDEVDSAEADKVSKVIDEELHNMSAPLICFDSLKAFTTQGGGAHVVYLAASKVPGGLSDLVYKVRERLEDCGYHLGPYQLHVTLARIPSKSIKLETLRRRLQGIDAPVLPKVLKRADYRFYKEFSRTVREWEFQVLHFNTQN